KIESATNDEVKIAERICSDQIQLACEIVVVFLLSEFAQTRPAKAQRQNSPFCEVDAALLLVFGQIAKRLVPGQIQYCRDSVIELLGLIKDRRRSKTRHNFVAILTNAVTVTSFNDSRLLELWSRIDPFLRPTMVGNVLQDMFTEFLFLHVP